MTSARMASTAASLRFKQKMRSLALVTTGAGAVFVGFNIYKGNERFYRDLLMPAMRYLPPEFTHNLAVLACKYKVFPRPEKPDSSNLNTKFFGKDISNPLGIAAGFDKQGEAVEGLHKLGFGFIEIGSVTPEPQPGNPTPRVFRLIADAAIINRYGFNSEGHEAVYERLSKLRDSNSFNGILGVNLGKNKTSTSAREDYVQGVQKFGPIADYLVINVSSPNTPGLRDLQGKKDLEKLLEAVIDARNKLPGEKKVPVLLKLSPDLNKQDIKDIASVVGKKSCRVDGLIVSNTTVSRENLKETELAAETGGLSGAPLRSKSTQLIADMYYQTSGKIPIIGVGGISSGRDAFEKLEAGATYLQCYTAFIYDGPPVVSRIKKELSKILDQQGYKNVEEVVGKGYKKYMSK